MIPDPVLTAAMHADLERRVREIARADSKAPGQLGQLEWVLAVIGFVVVPLLMWWWFG
jgi:hypothetical protein